VACFTIISLTFLYTVRSTNLVIARNWSEIGTLCLLNASLDGYNILEVTCVTNRIIPALVLKSFSCGLLMFMSMGRDYIAEPLYLTNLFLIPKIVYESSNCLQHQGDECSLP
jgi:hypothetical protein